MKTITEIAFRDSERICYACANGLTGETKVCYACANDLTGDYKYDGEEWECLCDEWKCRCQPCTETFCPICNQWFAASDYLATVFDDSRKLWLANMVMHYRHEHRAWDRSHGYISSRYGQATYERQKSKVNEQAKRQIIRKATDFLIANRIDVECFTSLQNTEPATIELAQKRLS